MRNVTDDSSSVRRPLTAGYLIGRLSAPSSRKLLLLIGAIQQRDLSTVIAWRDDDWQRRAVEAQRFASLAAAVEALAGYADDPIQTADLAAAREAWMLAKEDAVMSQVFDLAYFLRDCQRIVEQIDHVSVVHVRWMCRNGEIAHGAEHERDARNLLLISEVFGNPFQPVRFSPEWRTDTAVLLARAMYDAREFSAMPILADALQDAGCDNDDVLTHCRDANQTHVRGCWVCDLVLGKE